MKKSDTVSFIVDRIKAIAQKLDEKQDRELLGNACRLIVSQKEFNDDLRQILRNR